MRRRGPAPGEDWLQWNFYNMETRSSFYCSHLVWAAFRDTTGIDLNTGAYDIWGFTAIAPMEFPSSANSSKISIIYKA